MYDAVIRGHPGRERTLTAARAVYFYPTMRVNIDAYVDKCVKCAQHKGKVPRPAPILEYPPPKPNLVGLCGATVAHSAYNRKVPGSIPGWSGKIWAVFPISSRPCSPSSE